MLVISDEGTDVQIISTSSPYSLIRTFDADDNRDFSYVEFNSDDTKILVCFGKD